MTDAPDIRGDPVPVVVSLHRTAASFTQPCGQRSIVEQGTERPADIVGLFGIYQKAGLAFANRLRNPPGSTRDHGNPAGRGLHQRNAEAFHSLVHQSRQAEIDLGAVVKPGKIPVRHITEEADSIGYTE